MLGATTFWVGYVARQLVMMYAPEHCVNCSIVDGSLCMASEMVFIMTLSVTLGATISQ